MHIKTPQVVLAHVGSDSLQSAHLTFSLLLSNELSLSDTDIVDLVALNCTYTVIDVITAPP